jgi:hypothetical protein
MRSGPGKNTAGKSARAPIKSRNCAPKKQRLLIVKAIDTFLAKNLGSPVQPDAAARRNRSLMASANPPPGASST